MIQDGTFDKFIKKERLMITREQEKLSKILSGVATINRLPGAIFIVDLNKEHIAVDELIVWESLFLDFWIDKL